MTDGNPVLRALKKIFETLEESQKPQSQEPKICLGCGARQQPDGSLTCGH